MNRGFTILELIVVIGIMAVLAALTVPIARSIIATNQTSACLANLQKIGAALKLYSADYQGVPGIWIADPADADTPYALMGAATTVPTGNPALATPPPPNPLMVLYSEGYLKNRGYFHCPRDRAHDDPAQPEYYQSYTGREPDGTPAEKQVKIKYLNDEDNSDSWNNNDVPINRYRYLPCRIFRLPLNPDGTTNANETHPWLNPKDASPTGYTPPSAFTERRELSPAMRKVYINGTAYWTPVVDTSWWPDDRTLVTWCGLHGEQYTKDGTGQYMALFWDGSAMMKNLPLFEKGTTPVAPSAAWEVTPSD